MGLYGIGTPYRPENNQEYWFSDSSRRVDAVARYARPFAWGEGNLRVAFRESEAITFGRRIPPGSEGLKRFHYARNHGQLLEIGAGREPAGTESEASNASFAPNAPWDRGVSGLSLGAAYRDYAWTSTPSPDALDAHNETLSYNRLGLSFIANLYGGLFKESEIISGSFHAGTWEVHGGWSGRLPWLSPAGSEGATGSGSGFGSGTGSGIGAGGRGRFGAWRGTGALSLYRTDFRLRWEGHSLSQRVFSVDTSAAYGGGPSGHLIGATPRLGAAWSLGRFRAEITASQAVPLILEVDGTGNSGSGSARSSESYPWFRNGFVAEARLQAGY